MAKSFSSTGFDQVIRFLDGKKKKTLGEMKLRRIADRYNISSSTSKAGLGGINKGSVLHKDFSSKHPDHEHDKYYKPTLFKIYNPENREMKTISEVLASHLMNLANYEFHDKEVSKVFFSQDKEGIPRVGVRFYSGYKSLAKIVAGRESIESIDCGRALAQSIWIGDIDGHDNNLGILHDPDFPRVGAKDHAVRIDFDWAFQSKVQEISVWAALNHDLYPTFYTSLNKESFLAELERLSEMDYQTSAQFEELLDNVCIQYNAHCSDIYKMSLGKEAEIRRAIRENMSANCIQMKFLSQIVKINVILSKEGEISSIDEEQIMSSVQKIDELNLAYPAMSEQYMFNLGNIFGFAELDESKRDKLYELLNAKGNTELVRTLELGANRAKVFKSMNNHNLPSVYDAIVKTENEEFFNVLKNNPIYTERFPDLRAWKERDELRNKIKQLEFDLRKGIKEITIEDLDQIKKFISESSASKELDEFADRFLSPKVIDKIIRFAAGKNDFDTIKIMLASSSYSITAEALSSIRNLLYRINQDTYIPWERELHEKLLKHYIEKKDYTIATKLYDLGNPTLDSLSTEEKRSFIEEYKKIKGKELEGHSDKFTRAENTAHKIAKKSSIVSKSSSGAGKEVGYH